MTTNKRASRRLGHGQIPARDRNGETDIPLTGTAADFLYQSAPPLQRRRLQSAGSQPSEGRPQLGMPHCTPGPEIDGLTETRGPPLTMLLRRCAAAALAGMRGQRNSGAGHGP
jgi:hypothetical protein